MRITDLREYLERNFKGMQAFDTPNIVGDMLHCCYAKHDVQVWYCEDYEYIEIFGLTRSEFVSLGDIIDVCY